MRLVRALMVAGAITMTGPTWALEETKRTLSDPQWRADLAQAAQSIKDIHFKPFAMVSETEFDAALAELDAQIPDLTDDAIIIRLAQIVARLHDGHTRVHLPRQYPQFALEAELGHSGTPAPKFDSLKFHQMPVQFDWFEDGVFVIGASRAHQSLIGQKVIRIGQVPIADVIERAKTVCFYENESRAQLMVPDRLALPEVLRALGIVESLDAVELTTQDQSGTERETRLTPLTGTPDNWVSGAPEPAPLWLRDVKSDQWFELLPENNAIYVQVNRFEENPAQPYNTFVAESLSAARAVGAQRYIIDLRHNSGGIGAWTTPFVTGLTRSEFNTYGRLYILIGRTTFSAAQHFLHQFEELSYAMFVGEPSGAMPSHFGDAKRVVLENSGITLRVSTLYWHSWLANDFREAITPHLEAPLTSTDYFSGQDPALKAAFTYTPPAGVALQMDEQLRLGHNQNGLLLFQRYLTDGTYTGLEEAIPSLVKMAGGLLDDGFTKPGMFVLLLVNQAYPGIPEVEAGLSRSQEMLKD